MDLAGSPSVGDLVALLQQMADEHYGENVTMLEHSLQTAALAEHAGSAPELVGAALLHDVGHLLGDAGEWGLPSHAEVGAHFLGDTMPFALTEPIRLHVDAKRFLVATDETYMAQLSRASVETLKLQGGPFEADEAEAFRTQPYSHEAVALRRWDDEGKTVGIEVKEVESYRPLLEQLFAAKASEASSD